MDNHTESKFYYEFEVKLRQYFEVRAINDKSSFKNSKNNANFLKSCSFSSCMDRDYIDKFFDRKLGKYILIADEGKRISAIREDMLPDLVQTALEPKGYSRVGHLNVIMGTN